MSLIRELEIKEKQVSLGKLNKLEKAKMTDILAVILPNYKPLPKQKAFHDSKAYEKGIKGGFGSGKTHPFICEAIGLAFVNAPIAGLLVYPSDDLARDIAGVRLEEICKDNKLKYIYNSSLGEFIIDFGGGIIGNIWLCGSHNPDSLTGVDIAFAGMDEPFLQKKKAYENTVARIRNAKSKRLAFFWSGTPEPTKMEWGKEYFRRDGKESNTNLLYTCTMRTIDNIHTSEQYKKSLEKRFDKKTRECYLEGKFVNLTENGAYSYSEKVKYRDVKFKANDTVIVSYDFNVNPMTAVVLIYSNKKYYVVKEFYITNSHTSEITEMICRYVTSDLSFVKGSIIITGDASGRARSTKSAKSDYRLIRDIFAQYGIDYHLRVPEHNGAVRDRVNRVNTLLEGGELLIHELCEKLIDDLELVTWRQGVDGFSLDKSKADRTHISDALGYGVNNTKVLQLENQIMIRPHFSRH